MTRKSKREIERVIEDLGGTDDSPGSGSGETFADRHYSEPVASFVRQVALDLIRITHDPEIANSDRVAEAFLEAVREEYGIDDDRDDAALEELQDRARRTSSEYWDAVAQFQSDVLTGPALLDGDARERFDEHLAADEEDAAAAMIVRRLYECLADLGDDTTPPGPSPAGGVA